VPQRLSSPRVRHGPRRQHPVAGIFWGARSPCDGLAVRTASVATSARNS
jgi:hypothetical protein